MPQPTNRGHARPARIPENPGGATMSELSERVISAGSAPHLLEKSVYERVKAKYPLYGYLLAEMIQSGEVILL